MRADADLQEVQRLARLAEAALADEHEGEFTAAVYLLAEAADRLRDLVRTW